MASANKVLDSTASTIIKEEFIVPDDPVLHENPVGSSCEERKTTVSVGKREKDFVKKIKNRIQVLNKRKSSDDVEIIFEKSTVPAVPACALNNSNTIGQDADPLQAVPSKKRTLEISNKSETKNLTSSSILILQASVKNSNAHQHLENSTRKGTAISILKKPNLTNKGTTITISDLPRNKNSKSFSKAESVLKSAVKPVSRKVITASESENVKQIVDVEKDKSTLHVLNMKEKQIVIRGNNFIEIKKEVVEANLDEQIANTKRKKHYHGICFSCRKLQAPNDERYKCQVCLSTFHYECMRCRDILPSKDEYYNHLKNALYCTEIRIPPYLWNDSYGLATKVEKHQCSEVVWERTQKMITLVKEGRAKLKGKFNRIRSCCLICDTTQHAEHGSFWCTQCNVKSVFKCQTCNRSYANYSSAIHHTESRMVKKPLYECNNCSFKHRRKHELIIHIRTEHPPMQPRMQRNANLFYQCPDCHMIIRKPSYWRKHAYTCREKAYFRCTLCSEKYVTKKEIMVHLLLAHQMTDFLVGEMIKGIEIDRNSQEERRKQRKLVLDRNEPKEQEVLESNRKCKVRYRSRYVNPFCIECDSVIDVNVRLNEDRNCRKCRSSIGVQCKFCKTYFRTYQSAYRHINKCEKAGIASINKKTDIPNGNAINAKTHWIVYQNTHQFNVGDEKELENSSTLEETEIQNDNLGNDNNPDCHSILDSDALSNENNLEIDSTLEENEMQLDENNYVKLEDQDIKVFDGLINFDNYEVIIPDKIEH